jgi:predicted transcriptional regulator
VSAIEEARRVVETRLAELEREREQLLGALESLSPGAAKPSKSRRRSSRSRGSHRSGGKRAARGQRQQEFLSDLSSHPGATMTEIARRIGVSPQQLYPIAHRLESSGAIVKSENGYRPAEAAAAKDGSAKKGAS